MKTKLQLMKLDVQLQYWAIVALVFSIIIPPVFPVMVILLASIQVICSIILGFKYDDKRRKQYLKVLFWIHGIGSVVWLSICQLELREMAQGVFIFQWIIAPLFLVYWCYNNAKKAVKEAEKNIK